MSVPNNTTFNLQQVTTEIYGDTNSGRNLEDCFNDAALNKFDINFRGNLDRLLNFRNYGVTPPSNNRNYDLENSTSNNITLEYVNSSGNPDFVVVPSGTSGNSARICARNGSVQAPAGIIISDVGSC